MSRYKYLALAALICSFLALWFLPILRAFQFIVGSSYSYAEDHTNNSLEDYKYSIMLFVSYLISLSVAATVSFYFVRSKKYIYIIPIIICVLMPTAIISIHPEKPIGLLPELPTIHFILLNILIAAVSTATFYLFPLNTPNESNA